MRFVIFTRGSAIKDGTWSATELMIWSIIEPNVYLISACLPAMRPILTIFFGDENSRLGSRRKYGSSRSSSNLKPSAGSLGGFPNGATPVRQEAGSSSLNNPFDSALYGDEIQLVSVVEGDVEGVQERGSPRSDQIRVEKGVDVVVNSVGGV